MPCGFVADRDRGAGVVGRDRRSASRWPSPIGHVHGRAVGRDRDALARAGPGGLGCPRAAAESIARHIAGPALATIGDLSVRRDRDALRVRAEPDRGARRVARDVIGVTLPAPPGHVRGLAVRRDRDACGRCCPRRAGSPCWRCCSPARSCVTLSEPRSRRRRLAVGRDRDRLRVVADVDRRVGRPGRHVDARHVAGPAVDDVRRLAVGRDRRRPLRRCRRRSPRRRRCSAVSNGVTAFAAGDEAWWLRGHGARGGGAARECGQRRDGCCELAAG